MDELLSALQEYPLSPDEKMRFWTEFLHAIAVNESLHCHTEEFIKRIFQKFNYQNKFDINHFYFCLTGLKKRFFREPYVPVVSDYLNLFSIIKGKVYDELSRNHYVADIFVETYNDDWQIAIIFSPGCEACVSPQKMASLISVIVQEIYEEHLFKGKAQLCNFTTLSSALSGYVGLREGFLQANELSELSFFLKSPIVVTADDISQWRKEVDYHLLNSVCSELRHALVEGDQKGCNDCIDALFNNILKDSFNLSLCSNTLALIAGMLEVSCTVYDINEPLNIRDLCNVNSYCCIEECWGALKTVFIYICEHVKKQGKYLSIVQSAVYYIKNNYYNDISLSSIAEYAKVTPSYLSSIFKRDVGMAVSEYIMTMRIENAKTMLKDTKQSVNQISGAVGFNDVKYFRRIFKNLVFMSPLEYRKSVEPTDGQQDVHKDHGRP